jgi:hypothetical protein
MTETKRPKRFRETLEIRQTISRFLRAYGRRITDDAGDLAELAGMVQLAGELDALLAESAARLHAAGYSWTEIAQVLGVSRQAARQRFAGRAAELLTEDGAA